MSIAAKPEPAVRHAGGHPDGREFGARDHDERAPHLRVRREPHGAVRVPRGARLSVCVFGVCAFQQRPSPGRSGRVVHPRLFSRRAKGSAAPRPRPRRRSRRSRRRPTRRRPSRRRVPRPATKAASLSRHPASRNRGFQPRRPSRHRHPDLRASGARRRRSRFVFCDSRRPPPGSSCRGTRTSRARDPARPPTRSTAGTGTRGEARGTRVLDEDTFGSPPTGTRGAPPPSARRWTEAVGHANVENALALFVLSEMRAMALLVSVMTPVAEARERAERQRPVEGRHRAQRGGEAAVDQRRAQHGGSKSLSCPHAVPRRRSSTR